MSTPNQPSEPGPTNPAAPPAHDPARTSPKEPSTFTVIAAALSAAAALGLSILLWFTLYGLGSTLNSEQFRFLLNIASVQTIFDVDKAPAPAGAPAPTPATSQPPEGASRPDAHALAPAAPNAVQLAKNGGTPGEYRSWRDLSDEQRRLPKAENGKPGPFNPERTEVVMGRFLGKSPCVGIILLLAMSTYTPTNLALLSCFAGLAGAGALRLGCTLPTDDWGFDSAKAKRTHHGVRFWATLMRGLGTGFVVYLTVVAGTMIVTGQPFQLNSPDDYTRLAGTISLASFVLAVRPRLFFAVLDNLRLGGPIGPATNPDPTETQSQASQVIESKPARAATPGHADASLLVHTPPASQGLSTLHQPAP